MKLQGLSRTDQRSRTQPSHSKPTNSVMNITVNIVSPSEKFRHSAAAGVMRCRLIAKNWFLAFCLDAGFASNVITAAAPSREAIEWFDIWISHSNDTILLRVLLISVSIVRIQ